MKNVFNGSIFSPLQNKIDIIRMYSISDNILIERFFQFQSLAEYTRTAPPQRVQHLLKLSKRLTTTKAVVDELENWDLAMSPNLEQISGRTLQPESLLFGGDVKKTYRIDNADWNFALK
jgi:hypothetical protein